MLGDQCEGALKVCPLSDSGLFLEPLSHTEAVAFCL